MILIHQGRIVFEERKDDLIYNFGVLKCRKDEFARVSPDDYIVCRKTGMGAECLVRDKEAAKRRYKNMIVDNAELEDIMLFYIKGGAA